MSNWFTLLRWEAEARSASFKNQKSSSIKHHEQLNNRKAFISKKHNLVKGNR